MQGGWPGGVGFGAQSPPPLRRVWRSKVGKVEKIVKVWQKLRQNALDSYLIIISILWHLHVFCAATIFK